MTTLTLIGMGPGDPTLVTYAAWQALSQATRIYTPTPDHPTLANLDSARIHPLPADSPGSYAAPLAEYADGKPAMICAAPGDLADHRWITNLRWRGAVQRIPGISIVTALRAALEFDDTDGSLHIVPADALAFPFLGKPSGPTATEESAWCEMQGIGTYTPPFVPYPLTPTQTTLIWQWSTATDAPPSQMIQNLLLARYPQDHPLRLAWIDSDWSMHTDSATAEDLPRLLPTLAASTALAIGIPPIDIFTDRRSFAGLTWTTTRLLGPGGCPWDRKQTHQSLRTGLLEEAYEVLEALDAGDMPALAEELGDFLLQVMMHSEMARQAGHFDLGDVLEHITSKLIRRHPHVFGNLVVGEDGEVLRNWEQIKAQELTEKGRPRSSALDGIPAGLPALATAQKLVTKAARAGFDWTATHEVWDKLHEELDELAQASAANDTHGAYEELGDLLFAITNLARWLHIDAENALREAGAKFRRRFAYIEQTLRQQQSTMSDDSIDELLALWEQAKRSV